MRQAPSSSRNDRGFALLLVFLLAAAVALMLYQQLPRVAFESERDKEQLLIDRGEQYKRAIQQFYVAYKRYPTTIEELENTNNKRYLRKRYVDPYTGKSEWRLIHVNGAGLLTDSLVTKPPGSPTDPNNPNKDQLASNGASGSSTSTLGANQTGSNSPGSSPSASSFGALASNLSAGGGSATGGYPPVGYQANGAVPGANGVPGTPEEVNAAVLRRPSDRPLTPGQFPAGPTPGPPVQADPNNPNPSANGPGTAPSGADSGSTNPVDPIVAGQPVSNQPVPGQPALPQTTNPLNNLPFNPNTSVGANTTLPTADFPPISLQAMQQQQGNTNGANNGVPNGAFPGQQLPGQVPGQGVPGAPSQFGNQVRIGQNGQFIPVNPNPTSAGQPVTQTFPGTTPFPGTQPAPGAQPFSTGTQGQFVDPNASVGTQGGAPIPSTQGFGAQSPSTQVPGAQGPGGSNAALGLINQILTTPRQPPPGVSTGATSDSTPGGLAIAGVASKFDGPSVKLYNKRKKFKEWEFIFELQSPTAPTVPTAPAAGTGTGTGQTPLGGTSSPTGAQTTPSSTSPFGTSSTPTTPNQ
jgi:hypothetical protein